MMNKMVDGSGVEAATGGGCQRLVFTLPLGPLAHTQVRAGWILMCPTLCNLFSKFPFGVCFNITRNFKYFGCT